jgi:diaminopimelate epimerase
MRFTKMEGLGNDFVVLEGPFAPTDQQVRDLCDRRRGVGADGVLVVTRIDDGHVRMQYWNADGSAAELCGNGLRCVAVFAADRGFVEGDTFVIGPRMARLEAGQVTVELGTVRAAREPSQIEGVVVREVNVGNPHAVVRVEDPASAPVGELGSRLEGAVSDGVNVEFATVRSRELVEVRVWERGVGETLACGTGAAAVVSATRAEGLTGPDATVRLPGGDLRVHLEQDSAWITGPAVAVFEGEWHG